MAVGTGMLKIKTIPSVPSCRLALLSLSVLLKIIRATSALATGMCRATKARCAYFGPCWEFIHSQMIPRVIWSPIRATFIRVVASYFEPGLVNGMISVSTFIELLCRHPEPMWWVRRYIYIRARSSIRRASPFQLLLAPPFASRSSSILATRFLNSSYWHFS